jgi:hypothetical protein
VRFAGCPRLSIEIEVEAIGDPGAAQIRNLAMEMLKPTLERLLVHAERYWIDSGPEEVERRWSGETFREN